MIQPFPNSQVSPRGTYRGRPEHCQSWDPSFPFFSQVNCSDTGVECYRLTLHLFGLYFSLQNACTESISFPECVGGEYNSDIKSLYQYQSPETIFMSFPWLHTSLNTLPHKLQQID